MGCKLYWYPKFNNHLSPKKFLKIYFIFFIDFKLVVIKLFIYIISTTRGLILFIIIVDVYQFIVHCLIS